MHYKYCITLKGSPLSQFSVNRQYNSSVSVTHRIKATNIYFNAPDISMSWFALVDGAAPVTPQAQGDNVLSNLCYAPGSYEPQKIIGARRYPMGL